MGVAGQTIQGPPDITPSEARKITPFPPKDVRVKRDDGTVTIWWKPIPFGIEEYRIYKIYGDTRVAIGTVQKPPFHYVDADSNPAVSYEVTAVSHYKSESSPVKAKPVQDDECNTPR
jgi:hypothetical protein